MIEELWQYIFGILAIIVTVVLSFLGLFHKISTVAKELQQVMQEAQEVFIASQEFMGCLFEASVDEHISKEELRDIVCRARLTGIELKEAKQRLLIAIKNIKDLFRK